jgi:hypothetical protein
MSGPAAEFARGGLATNLTDEQLAALKATAEQLSSPGKGFLAADESAGPWLRAGHAEAKKIPDTPENRSLPLDVLLDTRP